MKLVTSIGNHKRYHVESVKINRKDVGVPMLIIVLSSVVIGLLVWGFLLNTLKYCRFKSMYGEMAVHEIPSVKQAKRFAELKELQYRSYLFLVGILLVILFVVSSF